MLEPNSADLALRATNRASRTRAPTPTMVKGELLPSRIGTGARSRHLLDADSLSLLYHTASISPCPPFPARDRGRLDAVVNMVNGFVDSRDAGELPFLYFLFLSTVDWMRGGEAARNGERRATLSCFECDVITMLRPSSAQSTLFFSSLLSRARSRGDDTPGSAQPFRPGADPPSIPPPLSSRFLSRC